MTAKATAAILVVTLGAAASLAITAAGDPPITGAAPTVYRTITNTQTVNRRLEGRTIHWWRARAVANRREANTRRITLRRIQAHQHAQWKPTVAYAIHLAASVFHVDELKMRHVAYCESTWNPYATNGRYKGLFQLGWSPFGLSAYDPVANALSTAQTVAHDGGWRQWECG